MKDRKGSDAMEGVYKEIRIVSEGTRGEVSKIDPTVRTLLIVILVICLILLLLGGINIVGV
jgi:hypothetical protein